MDIPGVQGIDFRSYNTIVDVLIMGLLVTDGLDKKMCVQLNYFRGRLAADGLDKSPMPAFLTKSGCRMI